MSLKVVRCPDDSLSAKNSAVISGQNAELRNARYVLVNGRYPMRTERFEGPRVKHDEIGFNGKQRDWIGIKITDTVSAKEFKVDLSNQSVYIASMTVEVDYFGGKQRKKDASVINTEDLLKLFSEFFVEKKTLFSIGQEVVLQFEKLPVLEGTITDLELFEGGSKQLTKIEGVKGYGIFTSNSVVNFEKKKSSTITLTGSKTKHSGRTAIISPDWDFSSMGIGGLQKEFNGIFRRAFSSRVFPPEVVEKMGMKHVRGILLFGPPGTGKTLMAREIGKMLHAREPKIIHGPEILDKYVGQSEANIRALFADAEVEEKKMGIHSALHIIIFDEIDAICRQRGSLSGSTGVHDTVVNQLLAKIDGVEQLNNILLIGMTNRKDMIDEALLRPGRLEVQMEINLPDENGRIEILNIHTAKLRESNGLSKEVDIHELAKKTRNFSGAELAGLVRSATTTAMNRVIAGKDKIQVSYKDAENLVVTEADFEYALAHDIKPSFGISGEELESYVRNGIVRWGPVVDDILSRGQSVKQQAIDSNRNFLSSLLLRGPSGAGKTALAVHLAQDEGFPFVKVISPEAMIGFSESAKCQKIKKVFDDAYKSPISCIVMDDIERLLDYVSIGPRFSNLVLQAILVLLRRQPPLGHHLLILGTTSLTDDTLELLGVKDVFNVSLYTPCLGKGSEVINVLKECNIFDSKQLKQLDKQLQGYTIKIAIKKLLALADAASQSPNSVDELMVLLETEGSAVNTL